MQKMEPLKPGQFYHLFNRGINKTDIFCSVENYQRFLNLVEKHIEPVCEIFCWCLLRNHFHFLIRIKEYVITNELIDNNSITSKRVRVEPLMVSKAFSNLFNAYAQHFNKRTKRTGNLFERPFKRKRVTSVSQLKNLVYYIHYNPVKHGFTDMMIDYPWSSYLTIISINPTKINREELIGWFNNKSEFIEFHHQKPIQLNMETLSGLQSL